ncbi:MAG: hypothetical protein IT449_18340 [Phycisphaerales bacterium]|nr:hypothetical protein [Phycisphaerales bacterium]
MFSWVETYRARNEFLKFPPQVRDSIEIELARIAENPRRNSRTAPSPQFLQGYQWTLFQYHDGDGWNSVELLFSIDDSRRLLKLQKLALVG